jgi:hypothetical protein
MITADIGGRGPTAGGDDEEEQPETHQQDAGAHRVTE